MTKRLYKRFPGFNYWLDVPEIPEKPRFIEDLEAGHRLSNGCKQSGIMRQEDYLPNSSVEKMDRLETDDGDPRELPEIFPV